MFWAIALPAVGVSLYFHAPIDDENPKRDSISERKLDRNGKKIAAPQSSYRRAASILFSHFKDSYSDPVVIQWSLWWALASCGFTQVQMYIQFLWQQINPDHENVYNGAVEALLTLLGVGGAFIAGYMNSKKFERFELWLLTLCSVLEGLLLLGGALTNSVWTSYVTYVIFGMLFHFMITVARYNFNFFQTKTDIKSIFNLFCSVNVAKRLKDDSFALVFGINTLLALTLQSLLTLAVISESGLALGARPQFMVYGGYFIALGIIYSIAGVVRIFWKPTIIGPPG